MNRDAILATLIGFGLGLLITGILIFGPTVSKSFKLPQFTWPKFPQMSTVKPTATPIPSPAPKDLTLVIDSPLAEAVVGKEELLVSGSSGANALVVIAGPNDEDVTRAGTDGKYAGKITLNEGKNEIIVTVYSNGKSMNQSLIIYYTSEEF